MIFRLISITKKITAAEQGFSDHEKKKKWASETLKVLHNNVFLKAMPKNQKV